MRQELHKSSTARTWAHMFLYSQSLSEAKSMIGGHYINVSLISTLLSALSITLLVETDLSEAAQTQRAILGASGSLSFGVFLATAIDCVLVDNSIRKLRSFQHCFIYLAASRVLMDNTIRLFMVAFLCASLEVCAMVNILYVDLTWPMVALTALMDVALLRRFILEGRQMDAFASAEEEEIRSMMQTIRNPPINLSLARQLNRRGMCRGSIRGVLNEEGDHSSKHASQGSYSRRLHFQTRVTPLRMVHARK